MMRKTIRCRLLLAGAVSLGILGCAGAASALLVENGQPRAEIVIAAEPARMTRRAAEELQTYIEKISGATLPIVAEPSDEALRIYVGISPHTEALGLETEGLKYGAYRMAFGPDWMALLGPDKEFEPVEPYPRVWMPRDRAEFERVHQAWDEITGDTFWNPMPVGGGEWHDDRGTLNAVHAFLHDLGVRWYMPGEIGEVVPRSPDIALPTVNRVVRPDFPVRNTYWFQGGAQPSSEDERTWLLRLGLHLGHDVIGRTLLVHGMKYVFMREEMKEAHPELFALRGDRRLTGREGRPGSPCLSSEGVLEKHVAYLCAVFDHYDEPMISIDPVDGFGGSACDCPPCSEQMTPERGVRGRMSDYVWCYLNRVAWEMHKTHPDRMVSGLTYSAYRLPPEKIDTLAPNLAVIIIPGDEFPQPRGYLHDPEIRRANEAFRESWLEKIPSGRMFTFSNVHFNWRRSPWWGLPVYFPRALAEDLRSLNGVSDGEIIECYEHRADLDFEWHAQAVAHLTHYAYSRLWWDAELDLDAMLDEYYTLFYGPARDEMKAFIEYSEENWPRMRAEAEPIDRALEVLAAAQAAADPDSVYGRRIRLVVDYIRPLHDLRDQLARPREAEVPAVRLLRRWTGHRRLRDALTGDPAPPYLRAWARVRWADNAIHFLVRCDEPDMEHVNLGRAPDGSIDVRSGDFVEILFETITHSYYRITIGPSGVLVDADMSEDGVGEAWTSNADADVQFGDNSWTVEVRIPVAGEGERLMDPRVGVDGRQPTRTHFWYFNVGRQRVRDGQVQRWAYSPTGTDTLDAPEYFARIWGVGNLR